MIDYWKPIGGFIENTIRPLLAEFKWFFEECDQRGLPITEKNLTAIANYVAKSHFWTVIIQCIQAIVITIIICATWIISQR